MTADPDAEYREMVLQGAKAVYAAGLVQFGEGNVSVRVKKAEELYITPSQNDYATMTAEDVVHVQMDGTMLTKGKPLSSEYRLHVAIYQARPKVNCVIHTHSPYAGMLSIVKKPIPPIFEEMVIFLGGGVGLAEYGQSGSDDLGANALAAMGDTNACLLTNHAVVGCGRDVEKAVKAVNLVEKMAMIYWGAIQTGDVEALSDEMLVKFRDYFNGLFSTVSRKK
jgi:ribulose-5-phosphate 4-epimerase/fuculose-1-phosphate aldolase